MCQISHVLCKSYGTVPPNANALASDWPECFRDSRSPPRPGVPSVRVMFCCSDCYLFVLLLLRLLLADPTMSLFLSVYLPNRKQVALGVCLLGVSGVLMFIQCFCKRLRLRPPMSHDVRCALAVVLLEQYLTTRTHKTHAWSTPPSVERHERVRVRESSNRIYAAHKRQVVFHLSSDAIPVATCPAFMITTTRTPAPLQPYIRMRRNNSERHLCAAMRSARADGRTDTRAPTKCFEWVFITWNGGATPRVAQPIAESKAKSNLCWPTRSGIILAIQHPLCSFVHSKQAQENNLNCAEV